MVAMGEGEVCRYRTGSLEVEAVLVVRGPSLAVQIQRFITMFRVGV